MLKRLIGGALLVAIAAAVVQNMPDVARYMRIRDM